MSEQICQIDTNDFKMIKGVNSEGLKNEIGLMVGSPNKYSDYLEKVLLTSEKIKKIKEGEIKFSEPILWQSGNAIIFPRTINVIQGQAGVHKSRLAEFICAAMLKKSDCKSTLLGYKRERLDTNYTVVYVDTERNQSEQFPYALQSIQIKAGYEKSEHPSNFKYISLLEIPRKERFGTLGEYLKYLKKSSENSLFIVLDVSTDCIEDFNRTEASMELIDLMNVAINEYDVVFLCLIHENPKSEKARGHFGTELMNKASTVFQVSFVNDSNKIDTNLIKISYLKCRNTARQVPFYAKYSVDHNGLILADPEDIQSVIDGKKQKANLNLVCKCLEMYLGDGSKLTRPQLSEKLINELGACQRTIDARLAEILQRKVPLKDRNGNECILEKYGSKKDLKFYLESKEKKPNKIE